MAESRDQQSSAGESRSAPSSGGGRQAGLLLASTILVTAVAFICAGYAIKTGLFSLKALALQTALAAIASWLCFNAYRIRGRLAEAASIGRSDDDTPDDAKTTPRWGDSTRRRDSEAYDVLLADIEHARKLHYLFLAIIPMLVVGATSAYLLARGVAGPTVSQGEGAALGIVCLAVSCLWLVFSRSFGATSEEDLPESGALALAFRETQWASILTSAAIFSSLFWPSLDFVLGQILLVWVVLVCTEQLVRLARAWLHPSTDGGPIIPPPRSVLREAILIRGNPITSVFEMIEAKLGVSFRSSWAIRFVRRAAVPVVLLAGLLFWALSSLAMVGPSELGVRETCGKISGRPLPPGLHLKLPWPFGRVLRYPVKKVFTKPIGFVLGSEAASSDQDQKAADTATIDQASASDAALSRPRAYLWSKSHAQKEFALVLGDGAEVISVNALVYYKIREDEEGFLNYVYRFQNPVAAMEGYAYRTLMEQTRAATLIEVLSTNRAKFAQRLEDLLREYCSENGLGIDVVDVALINLHPPVKVADEYLKVINAQVDAVRYQVEANGERLVRIQTAETDSASAVATAKIDSAKRIGMACEESAQFVAVGKAFDIAPDAFKLRLRGDAMQELLSAKPLILIDKSFTSSRDGTLMLDLRPNARNGDRATIGVQNR